MTDERRDLIKKIRLSETEYEHIMRDAEKKGMNFSEYMRHLTKNEPKEFPEIRMLFKDLINEVNHIGININQITRNNNSEFYSDRDKRRLFEYMKCLNTKLKKVIDNYGSEQNS